MKPETATYVRQAQNCAERATIMLEVGLDADAARTAYLTCFHAAQALVFERTNKTTKTHKGLQTQFFQLTKDDNRLAPALRRFLAQAYEFKTSADYLVGEEAVISQTQAAEAVREGQRFMERVISLLEPRADDQQHSK